MTSESTYNGWTNYATWRVNLEICDDRINWLVQDIESGDMDPFALTIDLADYLKDDAQEAVMEHGNLSDEHTAVSYALAFLDYVNFYEIAETAIADNPQLLASEQDDA